ncbi:hypothetical protein MKZ38_008112 [Zalerion maritima]|uniref:Uncharacterized protein n=1 Tax=Zalerion maritima TaxID=339359 RepID=A0AAD5WVA8_9PEZI|nr:hypothetical protein MKZ38_008112 [Zalerion maritima]
MTSTNQGGVGNPPPPLPFVFPPRGCSQEELPSGFQVRSGSEVYHIATNTLAGTINSQRQYAPDSWSNLILKRHEEYQHAQKLAAAAATRQEEVDQDNQRAAFRRKELLSLGLDTEQQVAFEHTGRAPGTSDSDPAGQPTIAVTAPESLLDDGSSPWNVDTEGPSNPWLAKSLHATDPPKKYPPPELLGPERDLNHTTPDSLKRTDKHYMLFAPGAATRGVNTHPALIQQALVKETPFRNDNYDYNPFRLVAGDIDISGMANYEGKLLMSELQTQFNKMHSELLDMRSGVSSKGNTSNTSQTGYGGTCTETNCQHALALSKILLEAPYDSSLPSGAPPPSDMPDPPWERFLRTEPAIQQDWANILISLMFVRFRALNNMSGYTSRHDLRRYLRLNTSSVTNPTAAAPDLGAEFHINDKFEHLNSSVLHGSCIRYDALWSTLLWEVLLRTKGWLPLLSRAQIKSHVDSVFYTIYHIPANEVLGMMSVSSPEVYSPYLTFLENTVSAFVRQAERYPETLATQASFDLREMYAQVAERLSTCVRKGRITRNTSHMDPLDKQYLDGKILAMDRLAQETMDLWNGEFYHERALKGLVRNLPSHPKHMPPYLFPKPGDRLPDQGVKIGGFPYVPGQDPLGGGGGGGGGGAGGPGGGISRGRRGGASQGRRSMTASAGTTHGQQQRHQPRQPLHDWRTPGGRSGFNRRQSVPYGLNWQSLRVGDISAIGPNNNNNNNNAAITYGGGQYPQDRTQGQGPGQTQQQQHVPNFTPAAFPPLPGTGTGTGTGAGAPGTSFPSTQDLGASLPAISPPCPTRTVAGPAGNHRPAIARVRGNTGVPPPPSPLRLGTYIPATLLIPTTGGGGTSPAPSPTTPLNTNAHATFPPVGDKEEEEEEEEEEEKEEEEEGGTTPCPPPPETQSTPSPAGVVDLPEECRDKVEEGLRVDQQHRHRHKHRDRDKARGKVLLPVHPPGREEDSRGSRQEEEEEEEEEETDQEEEEEEEKVFPRVEGCGVEGLPLEGALGEVVVEGQEEEEEEEEVEVPARMLRGSALISKREEMAKRSMGLGGVGMSVNTDMKMKVRVFTVKKKENAAKYTSMMVIKTEIMVMVMVMVMDIILESGGAVGMSQDTEGGN